MADDEHLKKLREGVAAWNAWREQHPDVTPDLSGARLDRAQLTGINLSGADLELTRLVSACLQNAHLEDARLFGAWLDQTDLRGARLERADLFGAYLSHADLRGANLEGAVLERVNMINTKLGGANITGARVYGISAWDLESDETTIQRDLNVLPSQRAIGRKERESVLVDDLEVAQFVYLLLHNQKLRNILTVMGRKGVLLLGRFSPPSNMEVLQALRARLRELNYVPMLFDFARVDDRSMTETIRVLAGLSRFIIADVSDPRSAPLELQATVPDYMVPFAPIVRAGEKPFSMLKDLQRYGWVLPVRSYQNVAHLIEHLEEKIIAPANRMHAELQRKKAEGLRVLAIDEE